METITLYKNGDTFELTYKRATDKEKNKKYIFINEVLHEVISSIKINDFNVNKTNENINKILNYEYFQKN